MSEVAGELAVGLHEVESTVKQFLKNFVEFDQTQDSWCISFDLTVAVELNSHVPSKTSWYAVVSDRYPFGALEIFPAHDNGITATFPHQSINLPLKGKAWRNGKICVKTRFGVWNRAKYDTEPFRAAERLLWYIQRTIEWLLAASSGRLVEIGDPFELPDIPAKAAGKFAFNESIQTYSKWSVTTATHGLATTCRFANKQIVLLQSCSIGKETLEYPWANSVTDLSLKQNGLWIRFSQIPIILPWRFPMTWKELFAISQSAQIDIEKLLSSFIRKKAGDAEYLLIGFPVPENHGDTPKRMHWQACKLPNFPTSINARKGTDAYYNIALKLMFLSQSEVEWIRTENWAKDQITIRGSLDNQILDKTVLLIGCGAVGSLVAELLARLGFSKFILMDNDILEIGNFSRHTLDMQSLGMNKAVALAYRLTTIFPHITANGEAKSIAQYLQKASDSLDEFDVIIDASASDAVLNEIERVAPKKAAFISLSTGYGAQRLYLYQTRDFYNLLQEFNSHLDPEFALDNQQRSETTELIEGIGCWHPLLPARFDNIMTLVSAAIAHIQSFLLDQNSPNGLTVFEMIRDENDKVQSIKSR